jgi:hypothetical protein
LSRVVARFEQRRAAGSASRRNIRGPHPVKDGIRMLRLIARYWRIIGVSRAERVARRLPGRSGPAASERLDQLAVGLGDPASLLASRIAEAASAPRSSGSQQAAELGQRSSPAAAGGQVAGQGQAGSAVVGPRLQQPRRQVSNSRVRPSAA